MAKIENLIAYKGAVALEKAQWDNIAGMTVVFSLEQRPHELTAANPFKKFTKMRKGRVGTRFGCVLVDCQDVERVVYDDEMMLKGWTDGTNGWKVTFWIQCPEFGVHPFMDYAKDDAFGFCAVEIEDDEVVVDQVKRDKVTTPRKQGLSNYAALLCRTPEFWEWLAIERGYDMGGEYPAPDVEERAKKWMLSKLGISSRAALDSEPLAIAAFHRDIREPYAEWNSQRQ